MIAIAHARLRPFRLVLILPVVAMIALVSSASAAENRLLFQYKAWEVRAVAFDDGSLACVAKVNDNTSGSLSLWYGSALGVKLVFHSPEWDFYSAQEDISVRVDRRGSWDLGNADLLDQTIAFTLSGQDQSKRLLREIMEGNRLRLLTASGDLVQTYTLAGSKASINKLIECAGIIDAM
jgi:hypothetical protein